MSDSIPSAASSSSPRRAHAVPGHPREPPVALVDGVQPLHEHQLQRAVELEEQRYRRRPRRLPRLQAPPRAAEIEVEARRRAPLLPLPGPLGDGDEGETGPHHPPLLRPGDDDVEPPAVDVHRDRRERGDGVDEEQAVVVPDGLGHLGQGDVGRPGRGLVVRDQHGADRGLRGEEPVDLVRVGRGAVLVLEQLRHAAVGVHDLGEPVPEDADGHDQHALARRDVIGDGRLHPAGPGGGERQHLAFGPVDAAHALRGAGDQIGELGSAVVDHLAGPRLRHLARQRRGSRDAQVHGGLLSGERRGAGGIRRRSPGRRAAGSYGRPPGRSISHDAPEGPRDRPRARGLGARRLRAPPTMPRRWLTTTTAISRPWSSCSPTSGCGRSPSATDARRWWSSPGACSTSTGSSYPARDGRRRSTTPTRSWRGPPRSRQRSGR